MFVKIKLKSMKNCIKKLLFFSVFLVFGCSMICADKEDSQKNIPGDVSYWFGVFPTFGEKRVNNLELMMLMRKLFAKNIMHPISLGNINDEFVFRMMAFFNLYYVHVGNTKIAEGVFDVSKLAKDYSEKTDIYKDNLMVSSVVTVNNELMKMFCPANNDISAMDLSTMGRDKNNILKYANHVKLEYELAINSLKNAELDSVFDKMKNDPDFKKMCDRVKDKTINEQLRCYAEWLAKHCKNASDAHDKTSSLVWSFYKILFDYKYGAYVRWGLIVCGLYLIWTQTKGYLEKILKPTNTAIDGPLL